MPTLTTWAGKSTFPYSGTVATGTDITCGSGHTIKVPLADYGKTVPVGESRTNPPLRSLGDWHQANVRRTAIATHVASILESTGYATRVGNKIKI